MGKEGEGWENHLLQIPGYATESSHSNLHLFIFYCHVGEFHKD